MLTTPTLAAPDAFGNQGARSSLAFSATRQPQQCQTVPPGPTGLIGKRPNHEAGSLMRKLHSKRMSKPTLSKAALRTQLEAALANCHGPVTLCPPAPPPEADRGKELDPFIDEDEVAVTGR